MWYACVSQKTSLAFLIQATSLNLLCYWCQLWSHTFRAYFSGEATCNMLLSWTAQFPYWLPPLSYFSGMPDAVSWSTVSQKTPHVWTAVEKEYLCDLHLFSRWWITKVTWKWVCCRILPRCCCLYAWAVPILIRKKKFLSCMPLSLCSSQWDFIVSWALLSSGSASQYDSFWKCKLIPLFTCGMAISVHLHCMTVLDNEHHDLSTRTGLSLLAHTWGGLVRSFLGRGGAGFFLVGLG